MRDFYRRIVVPGSVMQLLDSRNPGQVHKPYAPWSADNIADARASTFSAIAKQNG